MVEETYIKINKERGVTEVVFRNANLVLQEAARPNKLFIHDYL